MIGILSAFDPATLAAFVLAGFLLNLTPGADFLYVSASGLAGGPQVGMAAAVGINIGIAVHVLAAAAGVSALLLAYPAAYDVIRYAGAAYLLWLAWRAWTDRAGLGRDRPAPSIAAAIRRGFLTNVLNPKTALFIFAFIPQFTDPAIGPVGAQILALGAIFLVVGFAFSLSLGALAGTLSSSLRRVSHILTRITGVLFAALAARLILD